MSHPLDILNQELQFQKSKLESPMKTWEAEVKLRIEIKIEELEKAIKLLKKNNNAKQ